MNMQSKILITFSSENVRLAHRLYAQMVSMAPDKNFVQLASSDLDFKERNQVIPENITHLVVLCSHSSVKSIAVSLNIEGFLKKSPRTNILPIRVTCQNEAPNKNALPAALLTSMGENGRLKKAPTPSYICDLSGTDDSYIRAARRILQATGLKTPPPFSAVKTMFTAIAASLAVVFIGASYSLNKSAQEHKIEAQNANLFAQAVLSEMSKELPKNVRSEHIAKLGESALIALSSAPPNSLTDSELSRRAKLLHVIGNAHDQVGNPDKAITSFQLANTFTNELVQRHPSDSQVIFEHSQSAFWLGNAAYRKGDLKQAEKAFSAYKAYSAELAARDKTSIKYKVEVAYALVNYGIVKLESGDPKTALSDIQDALKILDIKTITSGFATYKDKAQFLGWEADAYLELGEFSEAKHSNQQQIEIFEKLIKEQPTNSLRKKYLANSLLKLSKIEIDNGNTTQALDRLYYASDMMKEVYENDPRNLRYRAIYVSVVQKIAEIKILNGNYITAKLLIDEARRFRANNDDNGANDIRYREAASMKLLSATTALKGNSPEHALAEVSSALLDIEMAKANGSNRENTLLKGKAHFLRGLALEQLGQYGEAMASWRSAATVLEGTKGKKRRNAKDLLSRCLWKLGYKEAAIALQKELIASSYKHPGFVAFWKQQQDSNNIISSISKGNKL